MTVYIISDTSTETIEFKPSDKLGNFAIVHKFKSAKEIDAREQIAMWIYERYSYDGPKEVVKWEALHSSEQGSYFREADKILSFVATRPTAIIIKKREQLNLYQALQETIGMNKGGIR